MEYEKNVTLGDVANATLSVTIKKETIKEEYQKLLSKYIKEVALPGFRRGKVPARIFEAKYSDVLKKDLVSELVENTTSEIFEGLPSEEKPIYCSPFVFKEMPVLDFNEDFTFVVNYDVSPKLTIKKDEGFVIKTPKVKVSEKSVQLELEKKQELNAIYKERDVNESLEKGDVVTIDFKVFDGDVEEDSRQDFVYTLFENQSLYDFDDDIVGMKKGETKEIEKTYPEDYVIERFRGKVKKILVTIKAIKAKILPEIDDELAKDISPDFNTLEDLKKSIVEKLTKDVELAVRKEKETILLEKLREENPIVIPESMIVEEIKGELSAFFERYGISTKGVDEYIKENRDAVWNDMSSNAKQKIHNSFLIEKLKEKRNITISDEEAEEYLKNLANDLNMQVEKLRSMYTDPDSRDYLMRMAQNDKLFNDIFKTCIFEEGEEIPSEEYIEASKDINLMRK